MVKGGKPVYLPKTEFLKWGSRRLLGGSGE